MAVVVPTSSKLAVGGFLLAGNLNEAELSKSTSVKDRTTLGSGGFMEFVASLSSGRAQLKGYNDWALGAWDDYSRTVFGTQRVLTVCPVGDATASLAQITQGLLRNVQPFNVSAPGEIPAIDLEMVGAGVVVAEGQVTQPSTSTVTVTGNTTAVNVGAVSSTQSIYAAIHVISVTGTTPTATFQLASSTTSGGAYTGRGSAGAALSAQGDQWIAAVGPFTDTWWRLNVTVTGTTPVFTVLASIAII